MCYINGMSNKCWCTHSRLSHRVIESGAYDHRLDADYTRLLVESVRLGAISQDGATRALAAVAATLVPLCLSCSRLEARTGLNCTPRHAYNPGLIPGRVQAEAVRVQAELQRDSS